MRPMPLPFLLACSTAGTDTAERAATLEITPMHRVGVAHLCEVSAAGAVACDPFPEFSGGGTLGKVTDTPEGVFARVSVGVNHACALNVYGALSCWGWNPPLVHAHAPLVSVSSGNDATCGLTQEGEILCWPSAFSYNNQCPEPIPEGPFTDLSLSVDSNAEKCALRTDGSLACWGCGYPNQTTPRPSGTFIDVHAGVTYACAVRTDGSLTCWGNTAWGADPWPGETFTEVAVGFSHACALDAAGAIACFGSGNLEAPQGNGYSNLDAGYTYMCATAPDDETVCW